MNSLTATGKKHVTRYRRNTFLVLTLELRISTAPAGISIEVLCHEGTFLATGACSLVGCHLSSLVDLVHGVCLWHYSSLSFFFLGS